MPALTQFDEYGILIEGILAHGLVPPESSNCEIDGENHEDEEGEDLKGQPGHHDIVARIGRLSGVRGYRRETTTCRLEEEGPEIAWDELAPGLTTGIAGIF